MLKTQTNREIQTLFSHQDAFSDKKFNYEQLEGLPEPVQQYFKNVLQEGQPYIKSVRLKHGGRFKTGVDKKWTNINGEQYFTSATPGFLWVGKTSLFTARDMYIQNRGRLVVKLFSLIKVVDEQGKHVDQGGAAALVG